MALKLARVKAALSLALAMLAVPALAQQPAPKAQQRPAQGAPAGQPAAPAPAQPASTQVTLKPSPEQPEWVKVCGDDPQQGKTVCYTTRDFVSDSNQPVLAIAVYEVKNDPRRFIRLVMPLGFLLQPGLRLSIDKAQPIAGRYDICYPTGCFAQIDANDALVAAFKKAGTVKIDVQNPAANEVGFVVPLEGFTKAFDGAPIDPKVLQEQAQKLQEEMARRAKELRDRQQQGSAAPAPGAPATAAPKP